MTSETMGMFGLYLLTSCAVCPVRVNTIIIDAPTLDAARTADDASASACDSNPLSTRSRGAAVW